MHLSMSSTNGGVQVYPGVIDDWFQILLVNKFQIPCNGNALQLINTCPIDNCLMILHALTTESAKIRSYLDNNNELVCQILCKSLELVRRGEFAEAKLEWIKMGCPIKVGANGILDFWGNEETMFTQYLIPLMRSNVTSCCSSTSCPQLGVSIRWANTVALRYLWQCITKQGPI